MYTENDKNIMKAFIQKLISNPSLINEPILIVEENIIQFYVKNTQALLATFTSPHYFPNLTSRESEELFQKVLFEEIDKTLIPELENIIKNKINLNFLSKITNYQSSIASIQNEIINIIKKIIKRFEIRRNLNSFFKLINNNLIDKYISVIFENKGYISREINIVERLKLSPEMVTELIKMIIIVSLIGNVRNDISDLSLQDKLSSKPLRAGSNEMQKEFYLKLMRQFLTSNTLLNEDLLDKFVLFHLHFDEYKLIPATSRFARILFYLGKNYNPRMKIDKGADAYEKSWFQSQKNNFRYFGFDIDMLNELYRISAEKYW